MADQEPAASLRYKGASEIDEVTLKFLSEPDSDIRGGVVDEQELEALVHLINVLGDDTTQLFASFARAVYEVEVNDDTEQLERMVSNLKEGKVDER